MAATSDVATHPPSASAGALAGVQDGRLEHRLAGRCARPSGRSPRCWSLHRSFRRRCGSSRPSCSSPRAATRSATRSGRIPGRASSACSSASGSAVLFGVPLGLLMGLYPKLYAGTRSVIEPFRFIPPIAWIPLAIIFFSGLTRFAFLIFLGAFFPDLHLDAGRRRPRRADPPQGRHRAWRQQALDPAPRGRPDGAARHHGWHACRPRHGLADHRRRGAGRRHLDGPRPHDDQLRRAAAGPAGDRRHAADRSHRLSHERDPAAGREAAVPLALAGHACEGRCTHARAGTHGDQRQGRGRRLASLRRPRRARGSAVQRGGERVRLHLRTVGMRQDHAARHARRHPEALARATS